MIVNIECADEDLLCGYKTKEPEWLLHSGSCRNIVMYDLEYLQLCYSNAFISGSVHGV